MTSPTPSRCCGRPRAGGKRAAAAGAKGAAAAGPAAARRAPRPTPPAGPAAAAARARRAPAAASAAVRAARPSSCAGSPRRSARTRCPPSPPPPGAPATAGRRAAASPARRCGRRVSGGAGWGNGGAAAGEGAEPSRTPRRCRARPRRGAAPRPAGARPAAHKGGGGGGKGAGAPGSAEASSSVAAAPCPRRPRTHVGKRMAGKAGPGTPASRGPRRGTGTPVSGGRGLAGAQGGAAAAQGLLSRPHVAAGGVFPAARSKWSRASVPGWRGTEEGGLPARRRVKANWRNASNASLNLNGVSAGLRYWTGCLAVPGLFDVHLGRFSRERRW